MSSPKKTLRERKSPPRSAPSVSSASRCEEGSFHARCGMEPWLPPLGRSTSSGRRPGGGSSWRTTAPTAQERRGDRILHRDAVAEDV
jgi:hypothetical protein